MTTMSMQTSMGALADWEQDKAKGIPLEGNQLFLGLTMIVSIMHSWHAGLQE